MRIVQLTAENVKRLKAVSITPDGNLVQISGRNAQGKSSVLDSIAMVLGGKDQVCNMPIRQGAEKAKIVCKLDDLTVTRTFTPSGGGSLTVTSADGAKYPSPQAILDKLVGNLAFDPLAFSRMHPKDQREALKSLVGLDFSSLDKQRSDAYTDRTGINRDIKAIEAQVAVATEHADAPDKEVSITDLLQAIQDGELKNRAADTQLQAAEVSEYQINEIKNRIVDLEHQLSALRERLSVEVERHRKLSAEADLAERVDLAPLREQLARAEDDNRKFRDNEACQRLRDRLQALRAQGDQLTKTIESIDAQKTQALASAKFPVDGLSFDETGVLFNGIPFEQASAAEKLRVSVAMGLAMNPKLPVLLIRDGSLLDESNLEMISQLAAEHDAQIWIERVGKVDGISVVIEDGMIAEAPALTKA